MTPSHAAPSRSLDPDTIARLRDLARDVDPALFAEILTTFRDDVVKYITAMQTALAGNDAALFERSAHAMKGASLNTGALTLGGLSARMEEAAKTSHPAVLGALLSEAEGEVRRVLDDIALELSASA